MSSLVRSDFFKIISSKATWVMLLVSIIGSIVLISSAYFVDTGGISVETATGALSLFAEPQMIALLGSIVVGIILCTDFENKQIESAIANGHSRSNIIIIKFFNLTVLTFLIYLPYILLMAILSIINIDFQGFLPTPVLNVIADSSEIDLNLFINIIIVSFTSLFIYIGQLSISILYMFIFKRSVLVIATTYITILILGPISSLNDTLNSIMTFTPYGIDLTQFHMNLEMGFVFKSIIISVVFTLVLYLVCYLSFRRAEVK